MAQAAVANREETESALISRAQTALSRCNWEVGECAALWTKRFSKGRTDADFGVFVGLSADQIYQRRRVWETFGDVHQNYPSLKWSHFYAALNWDDAAECLQWAADVQAGVAEMKVWRKAQRGEDLTIRDESDNFDVGPVELTFVGETAPFDADAPRQTTGKEKGSAPEAGQRLASLTTAQPPVGSDGTDYSPFRPDAGSVPPREEGDRPEPTTEQLVKRMTTAIERCHSAINKQFCQQFGKLPEKIRLRFLKSIEQLSEKTESLK